jgi:hypothetical protein
MTYTYGEDAEYDAYIESQIDPEWTGRDADPFGWQADREQARWERDRGTTDALYLWVGSILVAFGALSILWPLLVWLLLAAVALMAMVGVACVVVGARGERG